MIRSMCAISEVKAQFVHFRGNEFEHFLKQITLVHFAFAAEIDQLAVQSIARRAPPVLVD